MRGSELGARPPKPTPARPTVWRPPALPTLLAAGLALITLGVLVGECATSWECGRDCYLSGGTLGSGPAAELSQPGSFQPPYP